MNVEILFKLYFILKLQANNTAIRIGKKHVKLLREFHVNLNGSVDDFN